MKYQRSQQKNNKKHQKNKNGTKNRKEGHQNNLPNCNIYSKSQRS